MAGSSPGQSRNAIPHPRPFQRPFRKLTGARCAVDSINKRDEEQDRYVLLSDSAYYRVKLNPKNGNVVRHVRVALVDLELVQKGLFRVRLRAPLVGALARSLAADPTRRCPPPKRRAAQVRGSGRLRDTALHRALARARNAVQALCQPARRSSVRESRAVLRAVLSWSGPFCACRGPCLGPGGGRVEGRVEGRTARVEGRVVGRVGGCVQGHVGGWRARARSLPSPLVA